MSDIIIDSQFNGPPQSGNGGYCCGAFAAALTTETAGAIEVTLRSPPPLNRPLQHRPSAGGIEIFTQERAIADVRHASLSINYPTPHRWKKLRRHPRATVASTTTPSPVVLSVAPPGNPAMACAFSRGQSLITAR